MNYLDWIEKAEGISSADLTVRAQTVDPTDDGRLIWDTLFPPEDVDDMKVALLTTHDIRPVSDRREFDAPGRFIPIETPDTSELEMRPIEDYHLIAERELGKLRMQSMGNEQVFRDAFAAPIPKRVDMLTLANWRRLEVDAITAWVLGTLTVRNPQLGNTTVVSFNFDAARYVVAPTAWSDAGVNAYNLFLTEIENAIAKMGAIRGVMLSRAKRAIIQADAPPPPNSFNTSVKLTRSQLEERVRDDAGLDQFTFFENDTKVDIFGDAGTTPTSTRVWPVNHIAFVPDGPVGSTKMAPVVRAMDLAQSIPEAGINIRGQTVYYIAINDAKGLKLQVQLNGMSVPNEQKVYVVNIGA